MRYADQLGVFAGFIGHVENANRAGANDTAGLDRMGGDHQGVQRVAIIGQGTRNKAVVGRIEHRCGHEAIYQQCAHLRVDFVFNRSVVRRNLDGDINVVGQVRAGGDVIEVHGGIPS